MIARSIDVRNVSVVYPSNNGQPEIHALQNVSAEIRDGERVGIVGPNGAGKSTLLQVIAGVLQPTSGSVSIDGKVHAILSVGMGLREEATGREALFLDGALMGRTHSETSAKLQEMIDFAELGEFIDRPVRTYSSGMKTRLAFASLVTIDPEILIIDEALSVGDAFFSAKATAAMKRLTEEGAIVILVSHSLASIVDICERCIWMESGIVQADGSAAEVTNRYRATVHAREEEEIARKFGESGAAWTKSKSISVPKVELCSARDGVARSLIEDGEEGVLAVTLAGEGAKRPVTLRVWVERNDGLVLFDEQIEAVPGQGEEDPRVVMIDLGRLSWRPFIYQFHAEVIAGKGSVAHNATTVKIWSDHKIRGGAPLLRDPIQVRSRRI